MNVLNELFELPIFQNSLVDWALALGVTAVLLVALLSARAVLRRYHKRLLQTERTELTELPAGVLSRTTSLFFFVLSVFIGLSTLTMSPGTATALHSALMIAVFLQAGIWMSAAAVAWFDRRRRQSSPADRAVVGSLGVIGFVVRIAIWSMVVLLTLDNLGVDVTALVAGLGIGGIAIALAAQNILGDLFASLSITFDKPFLIGDFLIVDDFLGSVEYIGIKSTRLRSLSGEQIVMSNADLLKSRMRNYGRMLERRIVLKHGVTYETPLDKIERIAPLIRRIIEDQADVRFDRAHFAAHGAASLDFETVYYVLSPDYNKYMDIQHAINLRIHREFAELGIEFAYPTQKVYLARAVRDDPPFRRAAA